MLTKQELWFKHEENQIDSCQKKQKYNNQLVELINDQQSCTIQWFDRFQVTSYIIIMIIKQHGGSMTSDMLLGE